jgi:hypothetical protein
MSNLTPAPETIAAPRDEEKPAGDERFRIAVEMARFDALDDPTIPPPTRDYALTAWVLAITGQQACAACGKPYVRARHPQLALIAALGEHPGSLQLGSMCAPCATDTQSSLRQALAAMGVDDPQLRGSTMPATGDRHRN